MKSKFLEYSRWTQSVRSGCATLKILRHCQVRWVKVCINQTQGTDDRLVPLRPRQTEMLFFRLALTPRSTAVGLVCLSRYQWTAWGAIRGQRFACCRQNAIGTHQRSYLACKPHCEEVLNVLGTAACRHYALYPHAFPAAEINCIGKPLRDARISGISAPIYSALPRFVPTAVGASLVEIDHDS